MNSTQRIEIRLAGPDDAAAIALLLSESFAEYQPLYTPDGYAATAITSFDIIDRIKEGPLWVVVRDEVIVGTVAAVVKGQSIYIRGMAVLPSARGQHIGDLLLAQVEAFAAAEGFRRLFLSTTPFLDRAIRLYERLGFQRIDEGPQDLHGTPLFTMETMLSTKP